MGGSGPRGPERPGKATQPGKKSTASGWKRGACTCNLLRARRPAYLALDQPLLWVEMAGTAEPLLTIFMLSPPPIYLQEKAVSIVAEGNAAIRASGPSQARVW